MNRILRAAAGLLVLLAVALPVESLLDALALRYRTVAGYRGDFLRGLNLFRVALAMAGVVAAVLPALLRRARLAPLPFVRPARAELGIAALLGAATALAAFPGLFQSFQDDEWRVVEQYVRHGPGVILTRNEGDNQPLHSLLIWPFVRLFGPVETAVRIPVWIGASLAAPFLFLLLRRRGLPRSPAAAAGLLLALSPFLLQYAHESRSYALLFPCVFGLLLLQGPLIEGDPRAWTASAALGAAAVGFHLFAAPAVLALFVAPLAAAERRRPEILARLGSALGVAAALAFLLYAPVLPQMIATARAQAAYPADTLRPDLLVARLLILPLPSWTALPFLALLVLGLRHPSRSGTAAALGLAALLQVGLLLALSSEVAPRFLAPSLAIAWVGIADGLRRLEPRRGALAAAALLFLTLAALVSYYRIGNRDYRGFARELARRCAPGEAVAGRVDVRPLTLYLAPPPEIAEDRALQAAPPLWLAAVDVNLRRPPEFLAWLESRYEEKFRLPSLRGALVCFKRK